MRRAWRTVLVAGLSLCLWARPQAPLADRLAAAASDEERARLLDAAGPSVDADLLAGLQKRADAEFAAYRFAAASPLYTAVLAVAERLHNETARARAQWSIGRCLARTGKDAEAIERFQQSLAISTAAHLDAISALTLRSISGSERALDNLTAAIDASERSLELYRGVADREGIAGANFSLGNVYFQMGEYRQAAEYYENSLQIAEAIHADQMIDQSLKNLGSLYSEQGDYEVALAYMERVTHGKPYLQGDKVSVASTLSILGALYRRLERYPEALAAVDRGLSLAREAGDGRQAANLLTSRGTILHYMGRDGEALADYLESAKLSAERHDSLSQLYALSDVALTHLDMGQPQQALTEAHHALSVAHEVNSTSALWEPYNTLGKAYRRLNRHPEAEAAFLSSIGAIESWRTQIAGGAQEGGNFFSGMLAPYHELIGMKFEENDREGALRVAERAKAHQLLDAMARGNAQITQALSLQERTREQALSRDAAKWNAALTGKANPSPETRAAFDKAAREFEAFRATLYAAHPELKVYRGESEPLTLAEAGALLPDAHSLLLEYTMTDEAVYVFAIQRSAAGQPSITAHKLSVTPKALKTRIPQFLRRLAERDLNYHPEAQSLYRDLLAPVQESFAGKTVACIIPDGSLWDLPFHALIAPGGKSVLERLAVFYAPSLTALREGVSLRQRKPAGRMLLGMGSAQADLPHAAEELRALGRLYGAGSDIFLGADATEKRWKEMAPGYRILHVATHGVLNGGNPMFSYLKLRSGGAEDGMLEAREILDLNLHAELAILSACETARGEYRGGEGMVGIGWAMMMAGTPSVIVSQWKVDSSSTSNLMLDFHRNLRRGLNGDAPLAGKAEALRQAALTLMASPQYRHPYYWAGFQMVGDGY